MRSHLSLLGLTGLVLALVLSACGQGTEDDASPSGATHSPTPSPAASPSLAASEPGTGPAASDETPLHTPRESPADAAMESRCAAYLDYIGARDVAEFNAAIEALEESYGATPPPEIRAAIEGLDSPETGEIAEAAALLRRAVRPGCADYFARDVVGAADNETAARQFYDAVVSGDRESATRLAPLDVLAEFAPWEPLPTDEDADTPTLTSVTDDSFSMILEPTVSVLCNTTDGVVVSCAFGE